MKRIAKALALSAVLGFTCLTAAEAAVPGSCRYLCNSIIYETYAGPTCCSQTFTCPSGQTVSPYAVYQGFGWYFCSRGES